MLLTVLTMKGYAESSNTPEGVTKLEKSRAAINYYMVGRDGGKTNKSCGRTAWFNIWVEIVFWVEKNRKRQTLKPASIILLARTLHGGRTRPPR